jgi:hypothetical protein
MSCIVSAGTIREPGSPNRMYLTRSANRPVDAGVRDAPGETDDARTVRRRVVRCRACGHAIARSEDAIAGESALTFTNPHGLVFSIRRFTSASGCLTIGEPTFEHTWFPGCAWQVALCRACSVHVGWKFTGSAGFFGLIVTRIEDAAEE